MITYTPTSLSDLLCAVLIKSNPKFCFSGVIPNSDFLSGSGVEVDSRKAVIVDKVTQAIEDITYSQSLLYIDIKGEHSLFHG